MGYYSGLLIKDWKLSMKGQVQNYLILLIIWLIGIGAAIGMKEPVIAPAIGMALIVAHVFFVAINVFVNLRREEKLKLWLHNPNPAHALLSSKLVISILHCLLSITFAIGLYGIACLLFGASFFLDKTLFEAVVLLWSVLGFGLYLGIWSVFIHSQFALARGKRFEKLKYILYGLLSYFIIQVHKGFMLSSFYDQMISLGSFPAVTVGIKVINETEESVELSMGVIDSEFSLAMLALFLVVSLLVFFLSVRNVKKMEI